MDEPVEHLLREPVKPGRRLGSNYLVGERLGRGAMGVVHEATTNDGRLMAVKFLRAELAADHKTVARFLQERQIFRKLNHPNVVRVHDLVAEGDDLAIVMERVTGGDLKQRIESRSLTPSQSIAIAAGVAAGLQAIHSASVIHRDLKPANILLTEDLTPKISDFGISKLVTEAMTRTSATIGTPIYMAPEAADARGADAPADVYALGIMLFELLVGQPPFAEGGTFAVLRAHAMDIPPRVEGVPADLTELIAAMVGKEPAARPSVAEVGQRLAALAPMIGDDIAPIAVPPVGSAHADVDSTEVTGPEAGDRVSSDQVPPSGAIAAAAWLAADSAETVVNPDADADSGAGAGAGLAGAGLAAAAAIGSAADSNETAISHDPIVSGEPMLDSTAVHGQPGSVPGAAGDDATIINPGLAVSGAAAGTAAGAGASASFGGLDRSTQPGTASESVPFVANRAHDDARRTGGLGSLFPNRVPRRVIEVALAFGSLAAVLVVVALVLNSGDDDDGSGIASGLNSTVPAAPGANPDGGTDDGEGGPTEFTSNIDLGDDDGDDGDDGEGTPTTGGPTTSSGQGDPTTTSTTEDTTSTSTGSSSTSSSTTSTSTTSTTRPTTSTTSSTTTTRPTTTTTRPTTTTSPTTSSTTTSTTLASEPIRIVAGPTVNVRNATSFQFNYQTNDVCGTGSFRVTNTATGISVGSFTGDEVCFGPIHGGFPGLASDPAFASFDLDPGNQYRVTITVRGTASDGDRTAGTGTDSASFLVTTAL